MNDPLIEAIAERIRAVVGRQSPTVRNTLSATLDVPPDAFRSVIEDRQRPIDSAFLIDVVAALVQECAIDPQWLLSGQYHGGIHRQALMLGEDRTIGGAGALRAFVQEQYRHLQESMTFLSAPPTPDGAD